MKKLVTVIMSTYNETEEWISESVQSILEQTYINFEFIIILDNPQNITLRNTLVKYAMRDKRIKIIPNECNIGLVKSLNRALEYCNGYYVVRMDADDVSLSNRIENQVNYLEKYNLDFVFSGLKIIDENSNEMYSTNLNEYKPEVVSKLLSITNISNHPTWLLKKEVYEKLKGYRELSYTEDYDFTLRALQANYKIGKMPGYVLKYRVRKNSITRTFSLAQFLNSDAALVAYNRAEINNENIVNQILKQSSEIINKNEIEKFIDAENLFAEGVISFKKSKKTEGFFKILGSLFKSKYHRKKLFKLIRYKLAVK